jgi:hypothetical protein
LLPTTFRLHQNEALFVQEVAPEDAERNTMGSSRSLSVHTLRFFLCAIDQSSAGVNSLTKRALTVRLAIEDPLREYRLAARAAK